MIGVDIGGNQCDTVWVQVEISVIRYGYRWKSV